MVKLPTTPMALSAGSPTTSKRAMNAASASSVLEILRFIGRSSFQAAALGDEDPRGAPLQEEDDAHEHEDLPDHRVEKNLLQALVNHPDAQRADHGAHEIADAADDHGHE